MGVGSIQVVEMKFMLPKDNCEGGLTNGRRKEGNEFSLFCDTCF